MMQKKIQIVQMEFFLKSTIFCSKRAIFCQKLLPLSTQVPSRYLEPRSGLGPGNGKSQKTGSGPGTPLPSISGYPGNSLPGPTLVCNKTRLG